MVDNASQQRLLDILDELIAVIQKRGGIPITVARQTQMPFHATLLGLHLGDTYSTEKEDDIDPFLNATLETLQTINAQWKETAQQHCFDIQHDPKFSPSIKQQTNLPGVR